MAFVKLDCGILDSTLWVDREARDVFLTALLMAEPRELTEPTPQLQVRSLDPTGWVVPAGWYGFVHAAGSGIVRRGGLDRDTGLDALERLGSPEPDSRGRDFDGRRLVRVDGGFVVLNFIRYRERDHGSAERMRRWRQRKASSDVTPSPLPVTSVTVTQAEAEAEAEAEKSKSNTGPDGPETSLTHAYQTLLPAIREHLWPPHGKPTLTDDKGQPWTEARECTVIRQLLRRGHSVPDLLELVLGLAVLRDHNGLYVDAVSWLSPGCQISLRVLYKARSGAVPLVNLARTAYLKHQTRAGKPHGVPSPIAFPDVA